MQAARLLADLEGEVHLSHANVARLRAKLEGGLTSPAISATPRAPSRRRAALAEVQSNPECMQCMLSAEEPEGCALSPQPLTRAMQP